MEVGDMTTTHKTTTVLAEPPTLPCGLVLSDLP